MTSVERSFAYGAQASVKRALSPAPSHADIPYGMAPRIELIVRRGARQRFHKLKQKTKELPVKVVWDGRRDDRRKAPADVSEDRRSSDRRGKPPFTWEVGDFLVVTKRRRAKKR
jgi:hypothetical protein